MSKKPRVNLTCDSESQLQAWIDAAAAEKRKLPDWMRVKLDEAAEQALNKANKTKK